MAVRIIVVAADAVTCQQYQQQVMELGIDYDCVSSLYDLFEALKEIAYNGLLIDIPTLIKAGQADKARAQDILPLYPVLRLKWDKENAECRCLLQGAIWNAGISIADFIEGHCRSFVARKIRSHHRFPLHLNTLISHDDKFQRLDVERSTTLDISRSGCSLLTTQQWEVDTIIWLRFLEMEDQTPIKARVRHWVCWGTPMTIPSIGVSFEELTETQSQLLMKPTRIYQAP